MYRWGNAFSGASLTIESDRNAGLKYRPIRTHDGGGLLRAGKIRDIATFELSVRRLPAQRNSL